MAHYLVTIKPIEHFCFGVEKVGNLGNRKPYYLETTEFPQQTSILGLLRYVLLLKEGKLGKNISTDPDVNGLIGKQSFTAFPDEELEYGKINSLSPVFIYNNDSKTAYFARPLDWQYRFVKKDPGCRVSYGSDNHTLGFVPFLEGFKVKEGIDPYLISSKGDCIPLKFNEATGRGVLRKQAKAGNQKRPERFLSKSATDSEKVEAKNEAYYKQEFLYMERPYAYACVANIELTGMENFKTVLPFGGERSSFAIFLELLTDAASVDQYYFNLQPQNDHLRIELLSDAYVEQSILDSACFAVCDTIGFRNLTTKTTTKYYSRISKEEKHNCADLSDQLQLFKRGSVLFFDSVEQMGEAEKLLTEGKEHFTKIGYNKYRKFELKTIENHGTI
jgi:CRISPR-associated protein Cmr3